MSQPDAEITPIPSAPTDQPADEPLAAPVGEASVAPGAEAVALPTSEPSSASAAETSPTASATVTGDELALASAAPSTPRFSIPWLWVVRLLMVAASIVVGFIAQNIFEQARLIDPVNAPIQPWYVFAVAAVLLTAGAWRAPLLLTAVPAPLRTFIGSNPRHRPALILLAAAIVCAAISVPLFIQINSDTLDIDNISGGSVSTLVSNGAWLLFLASLALFGAALIVWESGAKGGSRVYSADPQPDQLPRWVESGVVLALFILALLLRVINLDHAPPGMWFDEAQEGVVARQITGWDSPHPVYMGGFITMGGLYFYILGLVLHFTGAQLLVLRLFPAISGALAAPLLYVLASRLFGWRVGVAASAFLAVSVWNISLSRLGMNSMSSATLDLAVLTCLVLGLRSGRIGWYGLAGMLLGLNLQIYFVARLLPLTIILLVLHKLISERTRFLRGIRLGLPAFILGLIVAFLPVGLFALQRTKDFMARLSTVSVFQANGLDPALGESIKKHLLMFNWAGDGNPRHDFASEPMLDAVVAALFVVGLGYCILRSMHWQFFLPVAWGVTALLGGILSLPGEAPQAHRTLENSITTALFAGIALGSLATALTRLPRFSALPVPEPADEARAATSPTPLIPVPTPTHGPRLRPLRWAGVVVTLLIVAIFTTQVGSANVTRYTTQSNAFSTWAEMQAPAYNEARVVRDYSSNYNVYVSSSRLGTPQQAFLVPNATPVVYPGEWAIPTADPLNQNDALVLEPSDGNDFARFTQLYPNAIFNLLRAPSSNQPLQYVALISAKDRQALGGVHLSLYATNASPQDKPLSERDVANIDQTWAQDAPPAPFKVRYTATIRINADTDANTGFSKTDLVQLYVENDPAAQITIDGFPHTAAQPLAAGLHSLVVETTINTASTHTRLMLKGADGTSSPVGPEMLFKPSLVPHGLTGYYRPGPDTSAAPTLVHVDPIISFDFHFIPMNRPYNVEWKGKLYVPTTGSYKLGMEQISTATLQIDDQTVLDNTELNTYHDQAISLTAGLHDIRVLFDDRDGSSHIYLYWTPPQQQNHSVIPAAFLWPVQASYPDPNAGGDWPTLSQADASVIDPKFEKPLPLSP